MTTLAFQQLAVESTVKCKHQPQVICQSITYRWWMKIYICHIDFHTCSRQYQNLPIKDILLKYKSIWQLPQLVDYLLVLRILSGAGSIGSDLWSGLGENSPSVGAQNGLSWFLPFSYICQPIILGLSKCTLMHCPVFNGEKNSIGNGCWYREVRARGWLNTVLSIEHWHLNSKCVLCDRCCVVSVV